MSATCSCNAAPKLIFSCSGAADVGEVADQGARSLTRQGKGKMFCLAGIGGRVSGIVKSTESAETILALDGCPLDCARKTLEAAGFTDFRHLRLTDLGLEKGGSPADQPTIAMVAAKAAELLG